MMALAATRSTQVFARRYSSRGRLLEKHNATMVYQPASITKMAGGLYLIYLASKIWRGAKTPLAFNQGQANASANPRKSFWSGLSTQLSNPKTAIYYGSIFAALLPQHPPLWCYFALPPAIFSIEAGWYTVVALCFSSKRPRELYLRAKTWVDRVAAGAITALGLRLIIAAHRVGL